MSTLLKMPPATISTAMMTRTRMPAALLVIALVLLGVALLHLASQDHHISWSLNADTNAATVDRKNSHNNALAKVKYLLFPA
jgi:hypothetical protein